MNHDIALYKKSLKKNLPCTAGTRKRLLQQFQVSADAYLEENPAASMADLCSSFGPPDEMAKVLMESVNEEEHHNYLRSQNRKRILAAILAILLIGYVTFVLFWKQKPISVVDQVTIETTAPEE